jgi:hypothetical protein
VTTWIDALPRDARPGRGLLAGPILRRATPDGVAVWLATAGPVHVRGTVFDGRGAAVGSGETSSRAFGEHLHLTVITMVPGIDQYPTDVLLQYDLAFDIGDGVTARSYRLADYAPALTHAGLSRPTFQLVRRGPVRLLHGSCRKLHGDGEDALALADDILAARDAATTRPAALFLTGDQIYADDVSDVAAHPVTQLARWLTGRDEVLPGAGALSARHPTRWARYFAQVFRPDNAGDPARSSARNHAAGLGEFAALYLLAFGEALWPDDLNVWRTDPKGVWLAAGQSGWDAQADALRRFRASLPRVRRALANIPTYMIFDDHEVSDDWNLDKAISDSVRRSTFGRRVVANALAAYLLFQGWGNDPAGTDSLVNQVQRCVSTGDGDTLDKTMLTAPSWSYVAPTSPPVVVLDTRTRRDLSGANKDVAGLLDPDALAQLGKDLRAAASQGGDAPVILVSATPVFGADAVEALASALGQLARYQLDLEFWAANPRTFRALLEVLLTTVPRRAVILSGDVHYGFVKKVWLSRGDTSGTIQVVQFTSSALQNSAGAVASLAESTDDVTTTMTVITPNGDTDIINAAQLGGGANVAQMITGELVAPTLSAAGARIVPQHNLGELVIDNGVLCRLYTPDRAATRPLEFTVDPFGDRPSLIQAALIREPASSDRIGPLLAQAGPGITLPTGSDGRLNADERAVVAAGRKILNTPPLRALANGIPLELLVGWISAESSGDYRELSDSGEAGYFQVDADTITRVLHTTAQAVIATPQSSLAAGLRMVRLCQSQVDRWTSDLGIVPADDDTRWRLVKLYHTIGAGSFAALLRAAAARVPRSFRWADLSGYWSARAGTIPGNGAIRTKLRQHDRMTSNVEKVMVDGARLAPFVRAGTPQPTIP